MAFNFPLDANSRAGAVVAVRGGNDYAVPVVDTIGLMQPFPASVLSAAATYTSPVQDRLANTSMFESRVRAYVESDQAGTLNIEESSDQTTWTPIGAALTVPAATLTDSTFRSLTKRYWRFRYVNGGTTQTRFAIFEGRDTLVRDLVINSGTVAVSGTASVVGTATLGDGAANPTNGVVTAAYNDLFNGTTWDRARSVASLGDATAGVGMQAAGQYAFNGTSWDRVRISAPSDGFTNSTAASHSTSFNQLFNGTSWDRARSPIGDAAAVTGYAGYVDLVYNGTTYDRSRGVNAVTDTYTGAGISADADMLFNGTTWERNRAVNGAADAYAGAGLGAESSYLYNGASWDRDRGVAGVGDGYAGAGVSADHSMLFNNATYDRMRNASGVSNSQSNSVALAVAAGSFVRGSIGASTTPTVGVPLDNVLSRGTHSMQVTGTGTGLSVNFEVSLDGTTWLAVTPTAVAGAGGTVTGSAATSNGLYTVSVPARFIRANLTAITAGSAAVLVTSA